MSGKITLVLSEDAQITESLAKETSTRPGDLVESLLVFQQSANDTLTRLILSAGDTIEIPHAEEADDSDDTETEVLPVRHKKRKT